MSSVLEALQGAFGGGQDVLFLNNVLRQYREIRKVYHYTYTAEDKQALKACATDLRPFTYSFVPAGGTYWVLSKMVKHPQQLGTFTRAALVLLRLAAAAEVFRVGYLVGSYRQGMECTRRLVELRSPLGGEIAAIIRSRDPQHPLLKYERQPTELNEDGSRPRIVNEANRLAQIAHLQRELAAAKGGQPLPASDHYNRSADEFLFQIMKQREQDVSTIQQGGGPAAAIASGRPEAVRPEGPRSHRAEYEAGMASATGISAAMGGGSLSAVRQGGGLVITDEPPAAAPQSGAALQQQAAELAAAAVGGSGSGSSAAQGGSAGSSSGGEAASAGDDPFSVLLGGGLGGAWGAELSEDAAAKSAAEEARQRRREAWKKRWWRRGGRGEEQQSW